MSIEKLYQTHNKFREKTARNSFDLNYTNKGFQIDESGFYGLEERKKHRKTMSNIHGQNINQFCKF